MAEPLDVAITESESVGSDPRDSVMVSVVVVTYRTPPDMLRRCLDSIVASEYRPLELLLVDNSPDRGVTDCITSWKRTLSPSELTVVLAHQTRNLGYAVGTNRGIAAASGALVLLLNPDTVLDPKALAHLVDAAVRRPDAIGFAPKVMLESHPMILDSVGIDLHLRGQGAQRGLGEPDIGQFDVEEQVAGLCFSAALIRRAAFHPLRVGMLDERYFMFYEDVDWSMRANLYGETFWSVPSARVYHVHSASTRHMGPAFKTRLIQRNLIWTAAKNLEARRVGRVVLGHSVRILARGAVDRHMWNSVRSVVEAIVGLPRLAGSRRRVQTRRTRSDEQALAEQALASSFDAENYLPIPSVDALVSVLSRLYAVAPSPVLGDLVLRLSLAKETSIAMNPGQLAGMVRESGLTIDPGLEWLLRELETHPRDGSQATGV